MPPRVALSQRLVPSESHRPKLSALSYVNARRRPHKLVHYVDWNVQLNFPQLDNDTCARGRYPMPHDLNP